MKVDNQASIFMAKDTTATKRTKSIDVRANFVYEHVNEETVKRLPTAASKSYGPQSVASPQSSALEAGAQNAVRELE